jgi:hypothetical protein
LRHKNQYGKAMPMTRLDTSLAGFAGRFTVDKTGLSGGFDVELTWTPDHGLPNVSGTGVLDTATPPSGPSILTALQEQLGLKLVYDKGPVAVLVVDRIEGHRRSNASLIPRQSRGLYFVSRSKRLVGVADAAPVIWATLTVAGYSSSFI